MRQDGKTQDCNHGQHLKGTTGHPKQLIVASLRITGGVIRTQYPDFLALLHLKEPEPDTGLSACMLARVFGHMQSGASEYVSMRLGL